MEVELPVLQPDIILSRELGCMILDRVHIDIEPHEERLNLDNV